MENAASAKSKVLIIMPVWNQLEYTKQAVESFKEFTPHDQIELLIINNGSTDGTKEYLDSFSFSSEGFYAHRIHVIHNEQNEGWTGACNQAFALVLDNILYDNALYHEWMKSCDYVLLANNDILLESDWLPKMLKRFKNSEVGIVGPTSNYVAGAQGNVFNLKGFMTEEVKFLIGFFFLMRREVLEQVGKFDEETFGRIGGGEELDFCIRARKLGWKCVIARDVFIKHFGSKTLTKMVGGEISSQKYNEYHQSKDALLVKKWGEKETGTLWEVNLVTRLRIALALPMRTDYSGHRSFWASMIMLQKPGFWDLLDCPRQVIQDSRNLLAQKAVELGCTHILFADDDHLVPSDAAVRLLEHDVDIVGALAFKRRPGYEPCVFQVDKDSVNGDIGMYSVPLINQGLQKVAAVGFSFMLIRTEVFGKLEWPYFIYGDRSLGIHTNIGGIGEDMSFCIKAGRAGFDVYCDTDLIVPHIGDPELVDEKTFLKFQKENQGKEIKPKILANGMMVV